jgi:hypothetical protein
VPCSATVSARWVGPGTARRQSGFETGPSTARAREPRADQQSTDARCKGPPDRPKLKTLASIHLFRFHSRGGFPGLPSPLANRRCTGLRLRSLHRTGAVALHRSSAPRLDRLCQPVHRSSSSVSVSESQILSTLTRSRRRVAE